MSTICQTKYPIMLIHGTGFRDFKRISYWGRIPKVLESHGAAIYYGHQDSWGSIDKNAKTIRESINKALEESGAERINLIAHSKGGLDARYLISSLGMADKVASLTTLSTPHHGSKTMDKFYRFPVLLFKAAALFVNTWFRVLGDKHPDFFTSSRGFSTYESVIFNEQNSDSDKVYYQSYGAAMRHSFSDFFMLLPHAIIKRIEGENDGLVSVDSAQWANFKGIIRGASHRGVSHCDVIDLRRKRLTRKEKDGCISDITDVYVEIVSGLKDMGF